MKEIFIFGLAFIVMARYRLVLRRRVNIVAHAPVSDTAEPPIQLTIWETSESCDVEIRDGRTGRRALWSVRAFADQDEAQDVLAYMVRQIKTRNVKVVLGK